MLSQSTVQWALEALKFLVLVNVAYFARNNSYLWMFNNWPIEDLRFTEVITEVNIKQPAQDIPWDNLQSQFVRLAYNRPAATCNSFLLVGKSSNI